MIHAHIKILEAAITNWEVLTLAYSSGVGIKSQRDIEPLALYFTQNQWMLVAYCRLRDGYREFKLRNIASIQGSGIHFPPNQFSLSDYFKENSSF